jgi:hypothetical protein
VLTEEELYAQCIALLFAGHETTRNLVGNGMDGPMHARCCEPGSKAI